MVKDPEFECASVASKQSFSKKYIDLEGKYLHSVFLNDCFFFEGFDITCNRIREIKLKLNAN